MGTIHQQVANHHLSRFPQESGVLKPFLKGFDITWGDRRRISNTKISAYFLRPDAVTSESFGFSQELLLVLSDFPTLEPRVVQAAETLLFELPERGRLDKLTFFLASQDPNAKQWTRDYVTQNQESRVIVAFTFDELRKVPGSNDWYVKNEIAKQLFVRDLFDYRLPLEKDLYFFGREGLIQEFVDAAKRNENRGIFGLRKTGKTSFLFKVRRILEEEGSRVVFFYDCKSPSIRNLKWHELIAKVCSDISSRLHDGSFRPPKDLRRTTETFQKLLEHVTKAFQVTVVFDEIEYISHISTLDPHWQVEFVPFWQTIWSVQSQVRKFSFVIAGVNSLVAEVDRVAGVQNPLFGIVSHRYLKGLELEELRRMVSVLGSRMGLIFNGSATQYLRNRYGGHPLLTRIACSLFHREQERRQATRPMTVTQELLEKLRADLESQLVFYSRHVVSELRDFYSEEYQSFEDLAEGNVAKFLKAARTPELSRHLQDYGLVKLGAGERPELLVPVLADYVAQEKARREGRSTVKHVIPDAERASWVAQRAETLTSDIRHLERLVGAQKLPILFGPNSFPEADQLVRIPVAQDRDRFVAFINTMNRCLVESIQNVLRGEKGKKYFHESVKKAYPSLWDALNKIRVYRHHVDHLVLNAGTEAELAAYLSLDLEGGKEELVHDKWFVLQQCVLDHLLNAVQMEVYAIEK